MWGAGLIVGTALHLAVIFSTPVDVANAVTSVLSLATTALLMTATFVIGKRARTRWEEREPREPMTVEQIDTTKG
jgi:hypothetical protein